MNPDVFVHYRLGVPFLDAQHWNMLCLLAQISRAESLEAAVAQIDSVRLQMDLHNEVELKYMRDMGFPFIDTHIENHRRLFATFDELKVRAFQKPAVGPAWIASRAQLYLLNHIDHDDRQFVHYYAAKNEAPK